MDTCLLAKTARLLEELFIPHTFLTSSQVEELFEAIKVPDSRVRVLHISSNRLSSVEPETLSTAVARLKEARMEKCSLSSPQVQLLGMYYFNPKTRYKPFSTLQPTLPS